MPEVKKRVRPAGGINTANRFSALQGLAPDPPDPPDPPPVVPPVTDQSPLKSVLVPVVSPRSPVPTPTPRPKPPHTSPRSVDTRSQARQINQLTTPKSGLIKLNGFLADRPAVFLVDCGATGNFVSESFVSKSRLPPTRVAASLDIITLADGRSQPAGGVLSSVVVRLGKYSEAWI